MTTSGTGHGNARAGSWASETEGTHSVPGLESEVIVLDFEVEVGENELKCI